MKNFKTTRTALSVFFIFSLLLLCALHQSFASQSANKHLLWEVKSPANTVYIAGSIHLLRQGTYPLDDIYYQSFRKTKKLVLEVDPALMSQPATQQMTLAKALFPAGKTLENTLSKKSFQLASKTAQGMGINIAALNQYKPWFVAVTLTTLQLQKLGFNPEYGIDTHFYQKAQQDGKPTIGLETAEFQINLFADMPLKTQDKLLLQALEDMHIIEQEFISLINAWKGGDTDKLEKILLESFKGYPEIFDDLITQRNRNWEKQVTTILAGSEPCFIVVGAGHLLGDYGLIQLLEKKGYKVKQL